MAKRSRGVEIAHALKAFAEQHKVPEGSLVGKRIEILPWEMEFFAGAFGDGPGGERIRTAILSMARRNGKTFVIALIVCAALYGPLYRSGARIASHARSRKQARIIFDYCVKLIQTSGFEHLVRIKPSAGEIVGYRYEGMPPPEYVAMSAEASTSVGFGLYLAIGDEVGQIRGPSDPLCENIATSLGSYDDSLEILISTQAPSDQDWFSIQIDAAKDDPHAFVMVHAAPDDADPGDEAAWLQANPSAGHSRSLVDIRRQYERATKAPSLMASFRNLILNQRVSAEAGLFDAATWRACARPIDLEVFRTGRVVGGLDLSLRSDLTALVLLAEDPATEEVHCLPYAWSPSSTILAREMTDRAPYSTWIEQGFLRVMPGHVMRIADLAREVVAEVERYDVERVLYDRWRIEEFLLHVGEIAGGQLDARWDQDESAIFWPCGQGYKDMAPALDALEELVLGGRLRHGGNPLLTMAIANAVVSTDAAGNRKLVKQRSAGRIDPAVALAMAAKALIEGEAPECLGDSVGVAFSSDLAGRKGSGSA
jgi:phage terminase large subunit-like protein